MRPRAKRQKIKDDLIKSIHIDNRARPKPKGLTHNVQLPKDVSVPMTEVAKGNWRISHAKLRMRCDKRGEDWSSAMPVVYSSIEWNVCFYYLIAHLV